ncbi:Phenylalanyl-tRNA synthetase beta subunit [Myxozyma melibiosi]|uniref:phenylalanine--tRNA ligase n=1 Tax=Myxozyma melibiosi TaxID=54550 RepID=A0ABR1F9M1_9ASCO
MPTVGVDKEDLYKALGRSYTTEEFDELCFEFGIELDEDTSQGELPIVNGVQERAQLKIEIPANRYDMLCFEGIARALNIFLGREKLPAYTLTKPEKMIQFVVKPETAQIRQYISCAVLRGITFTPRRYESFIGLQDKLHNNLCRNRTLVSMGTHDLDTIEGPFTYEAVTPTDISFVPLNQTKQMNGEELMQFYDGDKHLGRFLHIIRDSPVYPVVYDAKRRVCSLPPIINSEHSKITLDTKNVLIEVTATDKTKVEIVVNQLVAMFSEYCSEPFTIEPVEIVSPHNGESRITPDISMRETTAEVSYINGCCGFKQTPEELCALLARMSLVAKVNAKDSNLLDVSIPCTRPDILHQCDIMEDAGIAYGFNNLDRTFPGKSGTIGDPFLLNKVSDIVRREVAMTGWSEVLPLILCSHDENFKFLRRKDDGNTAVKLANPKTLEYQVVRTSLLPGMLKTIRENRKHSLPVKIFEVSDVAFKDESLERKSFNQRHWAAVFVGKTSGFETVHGLLDRVMKMLRINWIKESDTGVPGYFIKEANDDTFFPGRAADIFFRLRTDPSKTVKIGSFGILHPEVLEHFEIPGVVGSALEVNIEPFL